MRKLKSLCCDSLVDFEYDLRVSLNPFGVVSGFPAGSAEYEQVLKASRERRIETIAIDSADRADDDLLNFIESRIPLGLQQRMVAVADTIFPTFITGVGSFFGANVEDLVFDRQVSYTMVGPEVVGLCQVKINMGEMMGLMATQNQQEANDGVLEASNQFLGVVSASLKQVGASTKIGLPTRLDLSKVSEVGTLLYFPSVTIRDQAGAMAINLGFVNLKNEPIFSLSEEKSASEDGEVEFF